MKNIIFSARWREELDAISDEGVLTFELTMGRYQVYFPTQSRWLTQVPDWAKDQWEDYKNACVQWCQKEKIPIVFVDDAHVSFETKKDKGASE